VGTALLVINKKDLVVSVKQDIVALPARLVVHHSVPVVTNQLQINVPPAHQAFTLLQPVLPHAILPALHATLPPAHHAQISDILHQIAMPVSLVFASPQDNVILHAEVIHIVKSAKIG